MFRLEPVSRIETSFHAIQALAYGFVNNRPKQPILPAKLAQQAWSQPDIIGDALFYFPVEFRARVVYDLVGQLAAEKEMKVDLPPEVVARSIRVIPMYQMISMLNLPKSRMEVDFDVLRIDPLRLALFNADDAEGVKYVAFVLKHNLLSGAVKWSYYLDYLNCSCKDERLAPALEKEMGQPLDDFIEEIKTSEFGWYVQHQSDQSIFIPRELLDGPTDDTGLVVFRNFEEALAATSMGRYCNEIRWKPVWALKRRADNTGPLTAAAILGMRPDLFHKTARVLARLHWLDASRILTEIPANTYSEPNQNNWRRRIMDELFDVSREQHFAISTRIQLVLDDQPMPVLLPFFMGEYDNKGNRFEVTWKQ